MVFIAIAKDKKKSFQVICQLKNNFLKIREEQTNQNNNVKITRLQNKN